MSTDALNFGCNITRQFLFNLYCLTFFFGNNTEGTLKALNKTQLIDLFLKMQEQTNFTKESLMTEMKDLNNVSKRLESDVPIVKIVNNKILKLLENSERQCWANAQYSRRKCLEVVAISKTVESKDLEHTLCKVFNSIGFDIEQNRIETCLQQTVNI